MKQKSMRKASFTIEAACVMSLILFTLIGTLDLCFFVHNRSWLTSAAYEAAVAGSMEGVLKDGKVYETAELRSRELGNTGFFGAENLQSQISADKSVKVSYSAETISGFGGFHWNLNVSGKSRIICPARWIRKVKAAAEIIGG